MSEPRNGIRLEAKLSYSNTGYCTWFANVTCLLSMNSQTFAFPNRFRLLNRVLKQYLITKAHYRMATESGKSSNANLVGCSSPQTTTDLLGGTSGGGTTKPQSQEDGMSLEMQTMPSTTEQKCEAHRMGSKNLVDHFKKVRESRPESRRKM